MRWYLIAAVVPALALPFFTMGRETSPSHAQPTRPLAAPAKVAAPPPAPVVPPARLATPDPDGPGLLSLIEVGPAPDDEGKAVAGAVADPDAQHEADAAAIETTAQLLQPAIDACLETERSRNPGARTRVLIKYTLTPQPGSDRGRVDLDELRGAESFASNFRGCLLSAFSIAQFPNPSSAVSSLHIHWRSRLPHIRTLRVAHVGTGIPSEHEPEPADTNDSYLDDESDSDNDSDEDSES